MKFLKVILCIYTMLLLSTNVVAEEVNKCKYDELINYEVYDLDFSNSTDLAISEDILCYHNLTLLDLSNTNFNNIEILETLETSEPLVIIAKNANIDNTKLISLLEINNLVTLDVSNNIITSVAQALVGDIQINTENNLIEVNYGSLIINNEIIDQNTIELHSLDAFMNIFFIESDETLNYKYTLINLSNNFIYNDISTLDKLELIRGLNLFSFQIDVYINDVIIYTNIYDISIYNDELPIIDNNQVFDPIVENDEEYFEEDIIETPIIVDKVEEKEENIIITQEKIEITKDYNDDPLKETIIIKNNTPKKIEEVIKEKDETICTFKKSIKKSDFSTPPGVLKKQNINIMNYFYIFWIIFLLIMLIIVSFYLYVSEQKRRFDKTIFKLQLAHLQEKQDLIIEYESKINNHNKQRSKIDNTPIIEVYKDSSSSLIIQVYNETRDKIFTKRKLLLKRTIDS